MKWEYFSKRRRVSLAAFLKGVANKKDAIKFFESRAIELPEDGKLDEHFSNVRKDRAGKTKVYTAPKKSRKNIAKPSPAEKTPKKG
jgi:hypothetical protein